MQPVDGENSNEIESLEKSQFNIHKNQEQRLLQKQQQQRHGNLRKTLANDSSNSITSRRTAMVESDGTFDLMNCDSYDYVW